MNGEQDGMPAAWRMAAPRLVVAAMAAVGAVFAVRGGDAILAVIVTAVGAWALAGAVFALWLGWLCSRLEAEE